MDNIENQVANDEIQNQAKNDIQELLSELVVNPITQEIQKQDSAVIESYSAKIDEIAQELLSLEKLENKHDEICKKIDTTSKVLEEYGTFVNTIKTKVEEISKDSKNLCQVVTEQKDTIAKIGSLDERLDEVVKKLEPLTELKNNYSKICAKFDSFHNDIMSYSESVNTIKTKVEENAENGKELVKFTKDLTPAITNISSWMVFLKQNNKLLLLVVIVSIINALSLIGSILLMVLK